MLGKRLCSRELLDSVQLLDSRSTHHVPEMGAERACGLVILHHTVIVENFPTAVTKGSETIPE